MKKLVLVSVLAALAACSQSNTPAEPEATETAAAAAATTTAAAFALQPGVYDYKRSDGLSGINTVNADGTFSNARSTGDVETGKWAQEGGLSCLTPDGEGATKRCYTFTQPDADGKFTGTTAEGVTVEVRKVG
ncbi:hypothetical protein [Altererythrobacter sp. Root672]|uniref:hypothetical protein n=1 Tax=Altererythrobacter sp. Root672 TaxID=1736584 RepID=UPI0006F3F7BF|nr:hypothetical protein [Altererythrobacter sp. Root672]KRA83481.1 hypothetical protein ASD76_05395 [Altererythrobacter sp. Root672]